MIKSLLSAFLMYSRIPVPQIEWKEENRRYALGFFPLVGAVIGAAELIWEYFFSLGLVGKFLYSSFAVVIPVLITGGIHLDGFCDVTDAISSFADKEKRLQIMSDPHIGSFAIIKLSLYLLIQTALFSECVHTDLMVVAFGFVMSRSLSGFSAVTFHSAKKEGTLQDFVKPSHRKTVIAMVIFLFLISAAGMIFFGKISGIAAVISSLIVFGFYRNRSYSLFGGTTGDLCGWFLQLCEIWIFAATIISRKLMEVFI